MSLWNTLLQTALVGTARQPVPAADGMAGDFGALLQALQQPTDTAQGLSLIHI